MECQYGCSQESLYVLKNGKHCCSKSSNKCPAMRQKNSEGLRKAYALGRKRGIFTDENRKASHLSRISRLMDQPFELWGKKLIYNFLFSAQDGKCQLCGIVNWLEKPLVLHLDHIDGNRHNNKQENLRLLCPNCHSQTETYCGKNKNSGRTKVTDDQLWQMYGKTKNIHQTLLRLGLAPKGGNYKRMHRLIERFG